MSWNGIGKILYNKFQVTFIFMALFKPEAKNPPNGPIMLANKESTRM